MTTMTEEEWLICRDPMPMLSHVEILASNRKLRLFAVACCRHIWPHLTSSEHKDAVVVAERHAEGLATDAQLESVRDRAFNTKGDSLVGHMVALSDVVEAVVGTCYATQDGVECTFQANLVRHIIGNPFRPYPVPLSWPAPVVKLADALYAGEDCSFALHDAMLEAGHSDLAEHFKEKDHPKGCWVLDAILGKQ
jgi:hypothetical protein